MKNHRLNIFESFPTGFGALTKFNGAIEKDSGLSKSLKELVHLRVSMINSCAYCVDMHSKNLAAMGETAQRSIGLTAWRKAPYFSDLERSALALADELTELSTSPLDDELIEECQKHFTPDELAELVYVIIDINSWNRLLRADNSLAGDYQAPAELTAQSSES